MHPPSITIRLLGDSTMMTIRAIFGVILSCRLYVVNVRLYRILFGFVYSVLLAMVRLFLEDEEP